MLQQATGNQNKNKNKNKYKIKITLKSMYTNDSQTCKYIKKLENELRGLKMNIVENCEAGGRGSFPLNFTRRALARDV